MKRLLDTNAYSALRRGHPEVAELVRDSEALVFSTTVAAELMYGFRHGSRTKENLRDLQAFVDHPSVRLHEIGWSTADRFGRIAARLRERGRPIPTNDVWIAAETMDCGAELITFDHHFAEVGGLVVQLLETVSAPP